MAVINLYNRGESQASEAVTKPLPTSVKALAGIFVVLGLVIVGIVAWRVGKWRRSKIHAASQNLGGYVPKAAVVDESSQESIEKVDHELDTYKWQPIALPAPAHSPNKAVTKGPSRFFKPFSSRKPAPLPLDSPPPAYSAQPSAPLIAIHIAEKDGKDTRRATPHVNLAMHMLKPVDASSPLPSPVRSASMGPDSPLFKSLASAPKLANTRANADKKGLRLMTVACTFVPSLPDELRVTVGEPLRMLEEYEDEWCLVQRVGKDDAECGVVPRFCLQEVHIAQQPPRSKRSSILQSALRN